MPLELLEYKTGQGGQGQGQCRAGLGQIWSRTGKLWFDVEQRHVWQKQDVWRTGLGQVGGLKGKARVLHGKTRCSIG